MPKEIEVNGEIIEFPDDMPDADIEAVLRREFGSEQKQAPVSSPLVGQRAGEMPRLGFGDLAKAIGGVGETALQIGSGMAATPIAGLEGIVRGIVPGGKTGAQAVEDRLSALTYRPRLREGQLITGAIGEAAQAADTLATDIAGATGDTEDVLGSTLVKSLMLGGPALVGLRGGPRAAIADSVTKRPPVEPPSVAQLFREGNRAFRTADEAGVTVSENSIASLADKISSRVARDGIDPDLHPNSTAALNRLLSDATSPEGGMSFQKLDTLRRIAADAANSTNRADARFGRVIRDDIDNFIDNLDAGQTTSGNAQLASASIREARNLWQRARKGEEIERLITRARDRSSQFSGSGFENALRTEFRQLAMNDKRMRGFTAQEKAAIRLVANGGPLDNALRMVGKFAPTGVVSTGLSGGIGAALGGAPGAVLLPLVGALSRRAAGARTVSNAEAVSRLVRSGGLLDQ